VVLQLAKTLPYTTSKFNLYCDNLFTKTKLFSQLQELSISTCRTARKDVTTLLFSDNLEGWKPEWGTLWSKIDGQKNKDDNKGSGVLISA